MGSSDTITSGLTWNLRSQCAEISFAAVGKSGGLVAEFMLRIVVGRYKSIVLASIPTGTGTPFDAKSALETWRWIVTEPFSTCSSVWAAAVPPSGFASALLRNASTTFFGPSTPSSAFTPARAPCAWTIAPFADVRASSNWVTASETWLIVASVSIDDRSFPRSFTTRSAVAATSAALRSGSMSSAPVASSRWTLSEPTRPTAGCTTCFDRSSTPSARIRTARKFSPTPGAHSAMRQIGLPVGSTALDADSDSSSAIGWSSSNRRSAATDWNCATESRAASRSSRTWRALVPSHHAATAPEMMSSASSGQKMAWKMRRRLRFFELSLLLCCWRSGAGANSVVVTTHNRRGRSAGIRYAQRRSALRHQ